MADEETILEAVAALMDTVRWTVEGDDDPNTRFFLETSRRVKLFNEVPSNMQPACYQAEHGNDEGQKTGMPTMVTININWIIYQCAGKDKKAVPAKLNSAILKGVRKALQPTPQDPGFYEKKNTLGGLVHHCFIQGRVFKDPGDIDGQGMMVVPIKVLVPSL